MNVSGGFPHINSVILVPFVTANEHVSLVHFIAITLFFKSIKKKLKSILTEKPLEESDENHTF